MRPEVELDGVDPFATGGCRVCYRDPRDPTRCLKIMLPDGGEAGERQRRRGWMVWTHRTDYYEENSREWREYRKLAARLAPAWPEHLVACHGFVGTDRGQGLVADLVVDADGSPALNAAQYVRQHGIDARCRRALRDLRRFLMRRLVLLRDTKASNVVLREQPDGGLLAVLVDGLGNSEYIPVSEWIPGLARRKIRRKWRALLRRIRSEARSRRRRGDRPSLQP